MKKIELDPKSALIGLALGVFILVGMGQQSAPPKHGQYYVVPASETSTGYMVDAETGDTWFLSRAMRTKVVDGRVDTTTR